MTLFPVQTWPRVRARLTRPETPAPFLLTPRDTALLELVARFHYLDASQAAAAVGGSAVGVRRRLKHLFDHGYLSRPTSQWTHLAAHYFNGAPPLIYALARRGADLLAAKGVPLEHKIDGTFREPTRPAIAHAIEIATLMLAFDAAAAAHGLGLVDHHDLLPTFSAAAQRARKPFSLRLAGPRGERLSLTPDRLFSLVRPDGTRHNFCLEHDRGTESIDPRAPTSRSFIRQKLERYLTAFDTGAFAQWGFQRQRILVVTTGERRIASMLTTQKAVTRGRAPALFLYATPARLAEHGLLGPAWRSAETDRVALVA